MPLLDHFRPPWRVHHPWRGSHSPWANAIVRHLNERLLPERYYALPKVQPGGCLEIDEATIDRAAEANEPVRLVTTLVWAPTAPTLAVSVADADSGLFEVQVLIAEEGRLVAAIELVSPANKERPETRRALAVTCASLLRPGVSVGIIDVMTRRGGRFFDELLALLQLSAQGAPNEFELSAAEHRVVRREARCELESWVERLSIGSELPIVPIWLAPDLAAPLDLDPTYTAMCLSLRLQD